MKQITKFWSWFQDNKEAVKNAFLLGADTKEVFFHLSQNLNYVSKRIGFIIQAFIKPIGLLNLIELLEYIDYLYKKIVRKLLRQLHHISFKKTT